MDEQENTQTRKTVKLKLPTPPGSKVNAPDGSAPKLHDPLGGRDTDTGNLDILSTNTQTRKTVKLKPLTPLENHPLSLEAIGNAGTNTNSRKVVVLKPTPARPSLATDAAGDVPEVTTPSAAPEAAAEEAATMENVSDDTVKVSKHPTAASATIKLSPLSTPAPAEAPIKKSLPTVKLNIAVPPPPQIPSQPAPAQAEAASTPDEDTDTVSVEKAKPIPATPKPTLKMAVPPPPKLVPKPVAPPAPAVAPASAETTAPKPLSPMAVPPPPKLVPQAAPAPSGDNSDTIIVDKPIPIPAAPAGSVASDDRTVKVQRPVKAGTPPPPPQAPATDDEKPTIKLAPLTPVQQAPQPTPVAEPAIPAEAPKAEPPAAETAPETEEPVADEPMEEESAATEDTELAEDEKPYEIHIPAEALQAAQEKPSVAYLAMAVITLILLGGVAALNGYQYHEFFMK